MEGKVKVLHIIKSLGRGGAETLLPQTIQLHDQTKFEFHCIYFLPWKNQMVSELSNTGVSVHCLNASNNLSILLRVRQVIRYCKQNKVDIIHCHLPWAGFLGRLIHKITRIPVVYTEHNKQERYHKITYWINKVTFNFQSYVIAVSDDVKRSIIENINPKVKVKTILNGVNVDLFKKDESAGEYIRKANNIPQNTIVIGVLAVFRYQKRLKEWLQVFKEAHHNYSNLYGIIVGDGPLSDELLTERKRLGLEKYVLMPGLQTNAISWLSAMDIFMMTSEFEGLPIALLEAMSCECAIISTDAGGVKEVVVNNESGLITSVDNWHKLADSLNGLLQQQDSIKVLGKAARLRVIQYFSMKKMVNQLEGLYLDVLNNPKWR